MEKGYRDVLYILLRADCREAEWIFEELIEHFE